MTKNINTDKILNVQNAIKNSSNKINIKNSYATEKIAAKSDPSKITKNISNKFNDQNSLIGGTIAPWILKEVAKYPKGTFKRVNKEIIVDGEKVKIIFEGVKTDFDITSDGRVLQKIKKLL